MKAVKLPREWVEKAEVFMLDAKRHLEDGIYWLSCFNAHQSVEFYLKSLIIALTGVHPYTHDLVELLDALKAIGLEPPKELLISCELLTPHYTLARYPGRRVYSYTVERGRLCIENADKIISWVKNVADP
jgi:HEPN domain-containing protein